MGKKKKQLHLRVWFTGGGCPFRYTEGRELLQDQAYWGWFIPYEGCKQGDEYVCKDNVTGAIDASANLYHDEEQTPGWTGGGNGGACVLPITVEASRGIPHGTI